MKIYLETERLILREFTDADVDNLVELDADPEVTRYINGGKPTAREYIVETVMPKILSYYQKGGNLGIWAVQKKDDPTFMGWFLLRPNLKDTSEIELGYRFKRKYWGQGFATEGSVALVKKGFEELDIDVIMAAADPANGASRRVMEKVGLIYEKDEAEEDGFIIVKYHLDKAAYFNSKQATQSSN